MGDAAEAARQKMNKKKITSKGQEEIRRCMV
jgi:hypothetical protein